MKNVIMEHSGQVHCIYEIFCSDSDNARCPKCSKSFCMGCLVSTFLGYDI